MSHVRLSSEQFWQAGRHTYLGDAVPRHEPCLLSGRLRQSAIHRPAALPGRTQVARGLMQAKGAYCERANRSITMARRQPCVQAQLQANTSGLRLQVVPLCRLGPPQRLPKLQRTQHKCNK